jgi:RNA polymerase sigma-70 factor (ECF subfamily)
MTLEPGNDADDDRRLLSIAHAGRTAEARQAFERLYRWHSRRLLAFLAARVHRDDLDDLHQEVWGRAWHHLPGFRQDNFRAWLFEIARNLIVDQSRRRRPEPLSDPAIQLDPRGDQPDSRLMERERKDALNRCLETLDAQARALVRARMEGKGYPEIGGRLGINEARAYKLYHHAKGRLRTCLERADV